MRLQRCTLTSQWTLLHAHRFKSVRLALCLTPTSTSTVNWQTQAHSAVALIWQMCHLHATLWLLCIGVMTGSRRLSSSPVITCPKLAALFVHSLCHHCLVFVAISAVCNTPRSCSAPLVCFRHAGPGAFISAKNLMGIVSSMTEENQAALTAMLTALRERTASRSSSPLPKAALPTDESSTLPPEGASISHG